MSVRPKSQGSARGWKRAGWMLGALSLLASGCGGAVGTEASGGSTTPLASGTEQAFPGHRGEVRRGTFMTPSGPQELTYELVNGQAVFEGDILLPLERELKVSASSVQAHGAVRSDGNARWPGGVVIYTLDASLPTATRNEISQAIAHWEEHTPIRFALRTSIAQANYVTFRPSPESDNTCSSEVGFQGDGQQFINLGVNCSLGSTIHEIGHTLGLWHEQSRTDRDNHIVIHWENINPDTVHNFQTYVQRGRDGRNSGPYDLTSMMHYSSMAFSTNGLPTITKVDGSTFSANRSALSDTDICTIKRFYGYGRRSDINGDGYADLVIGTPYENVTYTDQGAVSIIFGGDSWLTSTDQLLYRGQAGVDESPGSYDYFGQAVAVGDFNGDCRADVAVGVPGDDVNGIANAGSVHLFYGSIFGANTSTEVVLHQDSTGVQDTAEAGDLFGSTLVVGDFNGDGYDDLAVGVPSEDASTVANSGLVNVLHGSATGLSGTGSDAWSQSTLGILDTAEENDQFGLALAAGDFNRDGFDELVVGVPYEDIDSTLDAGGVHVIPGSMAGLTEVNDLFWSQDSASIPGVVEASDLFGFALAAGDFNGDGIKDLAIGVPYEDVSGFMNAGAVAIINGSTSGLSGSPTSDLTQSTSGVSGAVEADDLFGRALAAEDFDGDGYDDLAVGVPYEDIDTTADAGGVNVLYGGSSGLTSGGEDFWSQDTTGIGDVSEANDLLGFRLGTGDYNGDGYVDLAIGVPFEDIVSGTSTLSNAGAVNVLYSGSGGLTTSAQQFWSQGAGGLQDTAEASDAFGHGL